MYWIYSNYEIHSLEDLKLLQRLFAKTQGELTIDSEENPKDKSVSWCINPFSKVDESQIPCMLKCRLLGPQSVLSVMPELTKCLETFKSSTPTTLLKEWA